MTSAWKKNPRYRFFGALAAIGLILVVVGLVTPRRSATGARDGRFRFSAEDMLGNKVDWDDPRFAGKVLLVNIWGTWCPPCRAEIPLLVQLQEQYRDYGLEVVGIAFEKRANEDHNRRAVSQFAQNLGVNYTVLYGGLQARADLALADLEDFSGYPTSVVIDREGWVRHVEVGFTASKFEDLVRVVREELQDGTDLNE